MFEKVLVALDFSPSSQKILDSIGEIPGIQEVVLLHVVDATRPSRLGWTHGPHIENNRLLMAEKKDALEKLGLKVRISVDVIVNAITQGTISQAILEIAETEEVSLIIVGARGINPIQELLLGSVSSTVLRDAKISVLIMRPGQVSGSGPADRRPLFSNVLVPTDFSGPANDVVASLKTLEGLKKVILLHVVSRVETKEEIDKSVKEKSELLAALRQDLATASISAISRVRIGDPTEMILSVAEDDDVSLIAMNAHGTDWLRTLVLGSTTFTVTRRAKKPVLVLRTGQGTRREK
jgi:nucleotide-binding universal stress UspA family protein